jgi:hypothetical protein
MPQNTAADHTTREVVVAAAPAVYQFTLDQRYGRGAA